MKEDGHTLLLTTHYIDEAEELCDRIAVIDRGRIIATGTPQELIAAAGLHARVFLSADAPLDGDLLERLPGVRGVEVRGNEASFEAQRPATALAALTSGLGERGIELVDLTVRQARLEDVYLGLTSGSASQETPSSAAQTLPA